MKKHTESRSWMRGAALAVLVAAVGASGALAQFGKIDDINIPTLRDVKVPEPERYTLDNGMVVYLLEDHEFPLVDARAVMRVGSIYEPAEKTGLANITGEVMRTGGSVNIDGDALDEKLESMGASVEISIGSTQGTATVSTLSADIGEGLTILADLLRRPALPDDKIDLAKSQERTSIASRNDEPFSVMQRELPKLIYGDGHPYARHTEYATVEAISRPDLVAFHKEFIHPDRIILTVYGDFEKDAMKQMISDAFGDWPPATSPLPPDPEVNPSEVSGNFLVSKDDMTNSFVALGHEGVRMDDPDYAALQLFHDVVGGGFSSRLFNEIRTKRGLAYATGSTAGAGMHHPGAQIFFAATQSDSTVATLEYVKAEIEKALNEPLSNDEVQDAKDRILNSMVFQYANKFSVLNRLATYEFFGYPADFLQTYQAKVKELTPEEVQEAAKRKIRYPDMATLVMGNSANFETALAETGPISEIDITIPEPEGDEIPMATPADFEKGAGLMAEAAGALGAESAQKIENMTVTMNGTFSVQGMELQVGMKTVRKMPDCEYGEQKLPMGTFQQAICGDQAWMNAMQGPQAMPEEMRAEQEAEKVRDYVYLLSNHAELTYQALPDQVEVEGAMCDVVYVHSEAVKGWKIYLDAATHQIKRMDYRSKSLMTQSPVTATEIFGDYKTVGGVSYPHARKLLHDGEQVATITVASLEINQGIEESIFEMPSN